MAVGAFAQLAESTASTSVSPSSLLSLLPRRVRSLLLLRAHPSFALFPSSTLSHPFQSPGYTGFFIATSLISLLAFVPWFTSGSLNRLLLHAPNLIDLSSFTTWSNMKTPESRALFNRALGLAVAPFDVLVVRTVNSRFPLGELTETLRWKPFKAGASRLWLGMLR